MRKFILFILVLPLLMACQKFKKADIVVHNAKIYTVNDAFDIAEAMAIKDGKVIAIGPEHEIRNEYDADQYVDAKMKYIYPGFIDAHCHFVGYALNLNRVDLVGTKSFEEVIERIKTFAKENPNGWIIGRGWDQNDCEVKEFPNRKELDELFPDRPVFIKRIDGHAALANRAALQQAEIDANTKVSGGIIEFNFVPGGEQIWLPEEDRQEVEHHGYPFPVLTGILIDNATELVEDVIPEPTEEEIRSAILKAQQDLLEVGLTTVDDAGLNRKRIEIIKSMHDAGELSIKVYAMVSAEPELLEYYLEKGPYKDSLLNVSSFKFYADGALGSRGACLLEPYSDVIDRKHYGLMIKDEAFYKKYAALLYEKGFQMNTHCIGDSANRLMLDIYSEVLKGTNDKRWRIEHAQVIHPDDFEKFKSFTIIPSVQSTHATSDMYWAKDRLGPERVVDAYAYKKLLQQNGLVALGTDFPIEGISPIRTFYAAVVRKDLEGFPDSGFQMENALSREEALRGITIWPAVANFEDQEKGSLEVGKSADFVILNNDLMEAGDEEINNIKVIQTFIDGVAVYSIKE